MDKIRMISDNIFTNFWLNIILLLIFVIFVIKILLESYDIKKIKKFKLNDLFLIISFGLGFIGGVMAINFSISALEKRLSLFSFSLLKIILYLILAWLLKKLFKFIYAKKAK